MTKKNEAGRKQARRFLRAKQDLEQLERLAQEAKGQLREAMRGLKVNYDVGHIGEMEELVGKTQWELEAAEEHADKLLAEWEDTWRERIESAV